MFEWFYGDGGQQVGPIDESALHALIASGRIGPATLLWREGMPKWMSLGELNAAGGIYLSTAPQFPGAGMMNPVTSGLAITSLICGIVGLATCLVFMGIPAVICGHLAMRQIENAPALVVGRGMAMAGLVCGYLSLLIMLSFFAMMIFAMVSHP